MRQWKIIVFGCVTALCVFAVGAIFVQRAGSRRMENVAPLPHPRRTGPVRPEPEFFRPNSHIPRQREGLVCGSIALQTFSPVADLVRVSDPGVWWESDHDNSDAEDDHLVHRSLEAPMRRLIELVRGAGGRLKVHDAYRAAGVHGKTSLHREGRALDLTCDELPMEKLAKLCWAAGFDWVFYEAAGGKGAHVHCSVKR